jgi:hypothetical protein
MTSSSVVWADDSADLGDQVIQEVIPPVWAIK